MANSAPCTGPAHMQAIALTCVVRAFSLNALGLGPVGLVVIMIVATLITNSLRGGYRLAPPGLLLAAPVLFVSFFVVILLDIVA